MVLVKHLFQDSHIILHCPQGSQMFRSIPLFSEGKWKELEGKDLKPGIRIRLAVKIHGISFLMNQNGGKDEKNTWGGRCRIQHRIQGILLCSETS